MLADHVIACHQEEAEIDELYLAEDICYKVGSLISHEMFKEFLAPYYQQLISNCKKRRKDKERTFHFKIDTDGFADEVIPWYRELGMDHMLPLEAAAGCDVVVMGNAVFGSSSPADYLKETRICLKEALANAGR